MYRVVCSVAVCGAVLFAGADGNLKAQDKQDKQEKQDMQDKQFDQWKAGAIKGWHELKQAASRPFALRATIRGEDSASKQPKVASFVLKQNGDSYLFEIVTPTGIKSDRLEYKEVQATNSRYAFVAKDEGAGWLFSSMDESRERAGLIHMAAKKLAIDYLDLAWTVGGHTFPEILDAPGFKLIKYQASVANQPNRAELVFSIPKSERPSMDLKVGMDSATVEFDPTRNWRVVKYQYTLPASMGSGIVTATIQYRDQDGWIDKVEQVTNFAGRFQATVSITTDSLTFRNIPESEFSLSGYGLPELDGVVWEKSETASTGLGNQSIPLYVWLLAAACVLGAVSALCRWLVRRRTRSVPVPQPSV
jgi:hypothetical protein